MKRIISGVLTILVIVSMFAFLSRIGQTRALDPSTDGPSKEVLDFNNGTKELITDFNNGTRNCIAESYVQKTAELVPTNETDQYSVSIPTGNTVLVKSTMTMFGVSSYESDDYTNTTQTLIMKQQMMLGFTYTLAYWQEQWKQEGGWWIFSWYLEVGVDVDIRFGLRLPINITLQYPDHMTVGNNYTIQATLDPVDQPNFNEFLLTCKAHIWAQAGLLGINLPRTSVYGPDFDDSQSFATPLGSDSASLGTIHIDIFKMIEAVAPYLKSALDAISYVVVPHLDVSPYFGSNLITAAANATGDGRLVEGATLNWTEPHQTQNFTVSADEYDPTTNYSRIVLSDFRYYLTKFGLDFSLMFDLKDLINGFPLYIPDPVLHIYTYDLSWITKYIGTQYFTSHSGYPGSIYLTLYVERIVPSSPSALEDVAIAYAYAIPPEVYAGDMANITVGAKNLGNVSESFNVTILSDNAILDVTSISGLGAGEEREIFFEWNTSGFAPWHTYNITAVASAVPNEIDADNNVLSAGTVQIVLDPPVANFTYSPVPPIQNQTTTFNASVSTSGNGPIVSYVWDFGEGVNMTTPNPVAVYVFAYYGNHRVTLTVIDSLGLNSTFSEVINVTSNGRPGDVNGDGLVNILDAVAAAKAFGSQPGELRWNTAADTNEDGKIDLLDLIVISNNFGNIYT